MQISKSILKYGYTTKNFHRFEAPAGSTAIPNEIYIPRAAMPDPLGAVEVTLVVTDQTKMQLKAKPIRG